MPTLENIRLASWRKPENHELRTEVAEAARALTAAADRGVVGSSRARYLAGRLSLLLGCWPSDVRWWLADHREEIASLLKSKTPSELADIHL